MSGLYELRLLNGLYFITREKRVDVSGMRHICVRAAIIRSQQGLVDFSLHQETRGNNKYA